MNRTGFLLLLLIFTCAAGAQSQPPRMKKADRQLYTSLQQHVIYLSHDTLEGRRTGTRGERLAAEYISRKFREAGLQPKGTDGYLQAFTINEGRQVSPGSLLMIDGHTLKPERDFFPLPYSANASIESLPSPVLLEPDMPWFWDLRDVLEENAHNPHFDISSAIRRRAREVEERGGTALIVYNSGSRDDGMKFDGGDRSQVMKIPVVYISREASAKYIQDPAATLDFRLKTAIMDKTRKGFNIAGFIDNGAVTTVVLGAHYDHLGYGEDRNSMHRGAERLVHNGADDNASGTAALIELARMLKQSKARGNNYLFIAFSGEELGLYGSKHFTDSPTVDLSSVNYMINMDMIGRLNDSSRLTVGGYGTSPAWGELYGLKGKKGLYAGNLVFRFDSSGTGPSDHTSFYMKNIPVLFYFTGLHTDYHKPTDDADKINYFGQLQVVRHIFSLIETEDRYGRKLVFTRTREPQTATTARFSVTLGIMPDYTFSGEGVRADGVTDGRPAQKGGMKAGDIVVSLDEHQVVSMESYMQALSKYKKGDKALVVYLRDGQKLSTTVEF